MRCPFCGSDMVGGAISVHWPKAAAQVRWEATDPEWKGAMSVLWRGLFRRPRRVAHLCPVCEAVLIAPGGHPKAP